MWRECGSEWALRLRAPASIICDLVHFVIYPSGRLESFAHASIQ